MSAGVIHFCSSGTCPGFAFPASKLAHPAATCGTTASARMDGRTAPMPRTPGKRAGNGCPSCAVLRAENERLRGELARAVPNDALTLVRAREGLEPGGDGNG